MSLSSLCSALLRRQSIHLSKGLLKRHHVYSANEMTETLDIDNKPEKFKSEFLQTLLERGFINQCTDYKGLDEKFCDGIVAAYLGFDATANSLHVGSLLQIMILRTLQKCGHKPIILLGGGTTRKIYDFINIKH